MDRVGNTRESFLGGPRVTVVTRFAQTAAVRQVIRVHSPGDEFFSAQRAERGEGCHRPVVVVVGRDVYRVRLPEADP